MPYKDSEYSTEKIYYYTNRETIFKTHDTMVPMYVLPSIPNLYTNHNYNIIEKSIRYDGKDIPADDYKKPEWFSQMKPVATLIESITAQSDDTIKIKFYDMTNLFFIFLFSEYRLRQMSGTPNVFLEKTFGLNDSQLYEAQRYLAPLPEDLQGSEEASLSIPLFMPVRDWNKFINTINNRLRNLNKKAGYEKYDYLNSEEFLDTYLEYDYTKENAEKLGLAHELVVNSSANVYFFNNEDVIWDRNGKMNYPIEDIRIGIRYDNDFMVPGFGSEDAYELSSTEIVLYPFEDLYYLTGPDDVESPSTGGSVDCCTDILSKIDELKESIDNSTEDIKNTIKDNSGEGGQGSGLDDETKCKINRIDTNIISLRNMLR